MLLDKIHLPLKAITVNQCWQGRRFKTAAYNQWRNAATMLLKGVEKGKVKWCEVELEFLVKSFSTTDVDNLIKPTLDALVESGILEDDRYITKVTASKSRVQNKEQESIKINIKATQ